ncbi:ABC transporter ATP-binding protein [Pendulispora rubella]|uniref:ABC transporter ATP-binding protein n=1 Tax=Pendulispora rubella TaxID=2741070 RepID=A0ABZ2KYB6_9BACT
MPAALSVLPQLAPPLLELERVEVVYDGIVVALRGVSLRVPPKSVVALLGPNGAGKSTTLKAASGVLAAERGEVRRGTVTFRGKPLRARSPSNLVREGLVQVLEGRHCFLHLTVEENLATGGFARRASRGELAAAIEHVYARFPRLREHRRRAAGHLSGGEQQMLAIGRALIANPVLLLLDEPSMGLAPKLVEEIFTIVRELHAKDGVSVLLAEQNAAAALAVADTAHVLENGRVIAGGPAADMRARADVQTLYLGTRRARKGVSA